MQAWDMCDEDKHEFFVASGYNDDCQNVPAMNMIMYNPGDNGCENVSGLNESSKHTSSDRPTFLSCLSV